MLRLSVRGCGDGIRSTTARGLLAIFVDYNIGVYSGNWIRCAVSGLYCGDTGEWAASARELKQSSVWRSRLGGLRAKILTKLRDTVFDRAGGGAEFLAALLLGLREDPADPLVGKFRDAGVSHVLALSGMHLGILAGLVLVIGKPFLGFGKAYLLTIPFLCIYIWIVGARPSMLRAGTMYLLLSVRAVGARRPDSLSVLAAALIIVSLIDPLSISTLSFQLSFLALFGIITVGSMLADFFSSYFSKYLGLPLSMSIGAQIATAPIAAFRFGVLHPIGIVTSVVISPLIAIYLWSGMVFLLTSLLRGLTGPIQIIMIMGDCAWFIMDQTRRVIVSAVLYFAQVPGIVVGPTAAWFVLSIFAGFLIWRRYLEIRAKRFGFRLSKGSEEGTPR